MLAGSVADAVSYLRRALAEPPEHEREVEVLLELGTAEARAGLRVGIDRLQQALELSDDPRQRALIAVELARQLTAIGGDVRTAIADLEQALADTSTLSRASCADLEAALIRAELVDLETAAAARARLAAVAQRQASESDPARLSMLALCAAARGESPEQAAELALSALGAGRETAADDPLTLASALTALTWMDEFDSVYHASSETLADASTRGSVSLATIALCLRSHTALRRGWVGRAADDARAALALIEEGWEKDALVYPTACLVDALIERGDLTPAAQALASRGFGGQLPERWQYNFLLDSRGRLRLAHGRHREAVADLLECGRRLAGWDVRNPSVIAWRSAAALALLQGGDRARAQRLANEELLLARQSGSLRAFGIALRTAGVVQQGQTGLQLLEAAVRTLERAGAELQLAGALLDLGVMLRAEGGASAARDAASRALDISQRTGATGLVRRAREELVAGGARPRRFAVHGLDALTARQREVAQLAARGLSNREIADALFVSENTVETHLRLAFRKLEISSRGQLAELLGTEPVLITEPDSQ
jgi:DNA-binding CsgD family transcriptional regulator